MARRGAEFFPGQRQGIPGCGWSLTLTPSVLATIRMAVNPTRSSGLAAGGAESGHG